MIGTPFRSPGWRPPFRNPAGPTAPRCVSGFFLSAVGLTALMRAEPFDLLNLKQNAAALWGAAGALGLLEDLRAERAAQVRANGGLLA